MPAIDLFLVVIIWGSQFGCLGWRVRHGLGGRPKWARTVNFHVGHQWFDGTSGVSA